jgi:hypothetical protein
MNGQTNSPSRGVGWIYFAAVMMMVVGGLEAIAGLTGIFKEGFYVVSQNALLVFNFKAWGWTSLLLGIIIFVAGAELLRGAVWARAIAVVLAGLSILANMAFMSAYPLWSILIIVIDVLIIHALVVRGGELAV